MPTENDPKNIRNNIKKSTWLRQTIFLCEITFLAAIYGEKGGGAEKGGNSLLQWSNNHWANCPPPPFSSWKGIRKNPSQIVIFCKVALQ